MGDNTGEVEAALLEFRRRGAETRDWSSWVQMFTPDATYIEHGAQLTHRSRGEIETWIHKVMEPVAPMTFSVDWAIVDGDHCALYLWNHLPDPTGTGKAYGFPNLTFLHYAGDGLFDLEEDFYSPADGTRVATEWYTDGGNPGMAPDYSIVGPADHAPQPVAPHHDRDEVHREFLEYRARGQRAFASRDWNPWADQFTDDARYYEHHYGRFTGQAQIREWINGVMQPFPDMDFPVNYAVIGENRVAFSVANRLPGGYAFDVGSILHYAGGGKWSYEEDAYNPLEAHAVIEAWSATRP